MSPLVLDLLILAGGIVPLIALMALCLKREHHLTSAHRNAPAE